MNNPNLGGGYCNNSNSTTSSKFMLLGLPNVYNICYSGCDIVISCSVGSETHIIL